MPIDPSQLVVNRKLPGLDWVLRGYLGQGGMGIVLDVVKPIGGPAEEGESLDGLPGAIKIIRPELAWRREYVVGLFAETRLLLKIEHPNIVRVLDVGCFPDATPFVVTERLVGGTLRQLLDNFGPLPPEVACEILIQASEALDHAHKAGIVHQDFKHDNVFVHRPSPGSAPVIKVLDFGIAAFRKEGKGMLGTPRYMAPEQLRGERLGPWTDVYASGLVLYELLTGRWPWKVPDENIVEARLHLQPLPPSHFKPYICAELDRIVLTALATSPEDRFASSWELADKLYSLLQDQDLASASSGHDTAPNLMTLSDVVRRAANGGARAGDTQDRFTPPPVEGRSLEVAPPHLVESESAVLRRRPTLRMPDAPPLPHEARPEIPLSRQVSSETVAPGPMVLAAAEPAPAEVPWNPSLASRPSVIIDESADVLERASRPPSPDRLAPGSRDMGFPESPVPFVVQRARSASSVSGTVQSIEPARAHRPARSGSGFLQASFIVPMAVLCPLIAVLGALLLRMPTAGASGDTGSAPALPPPSPVLIASAEGPPSAARAPSPASSASGRPSAPAVPGVTATPRPAARAKDARVTTINTGAL